MVVLEVVLFLLLPLVCKVGTTRCPASEPLPIPHEWYQAGDFLVGGIASQMWYFLPQVSFRERPSGELGFEHCFYYDERMTYRSTLDVLFKSHKFVPNYECGPWRNLIAAVGGLGSDISFHMAELLGLYKIPQLTYGSFPPEDKDAMPSFYRMVPDETHQYMGIIRLLQHFGWTWVGLLVVDDESGDNFLQALEPLFSQQGICSAFTQKIPNQGRLLTVTEMSAMSSKIHLPFMDRKARTFVVYGETMTMMWLSTLMLLAEPDDQENALERVWIMTVQIDFTVMGLIMSWDFDKFQGTLSFEIHSNEPQGFQAYLQNRRPSWAEGDGFLQVFWEQAFGCLFPSLKVPANEDKTCTGEERLETLPAAAFDMHMTGHSYSIYNAIYAVAHGLHEWHISRSRHRALSGGKKLEDLQPWQMHFFLRSVAFNNSAGESVSFNAKREMGSGFDIMNMILFPNNSFFKVKIGRVDSSEGEKFVLDDDKVLWQMSFNQVLPVSKCSDSCQPGYQKRAKEGQKFCCYDCALCPEGKISNQKDMDNCFTCPEDHSPSRGQDHCTPKAITFLSYVDPLENSLASAVASCSVITVLMLGAFIKHKETPIVKDNNQNLTYPLLTSLLLCFLCPLLFLGQPTKATCFLQQSAFGVNFPVAISCVTVILAFMATKPGSDVRRWVGKRMTSFFGSLIQVGIFVVGLATTPPFPNLDTHTDHRNHSRVQRSSVIMFYLVLGYLGVLSIFSFLVAFLARKLPDTFSEAKFTTFNMLVFCSVWLCFVPSCRSTKGKTHDGCGELLHLSLQCWITVLHLLP